MGMSAFARPAGTAGFDLDCVAFAVESDYFYRVVFELAVGVERAVEYVHYVGHDFEIKRVFTVRRGAFDFYVQSSGKLFEP